LDQLATDAKDGSEGSSVVLAPNKVHGVVEEVHDERDRGINLDRVGGHIISPNHKLRTLVRVDNIRDQSPIEEKRGAIVAPHGFARRDDHRSADVVTVVRVGQAAANTDIIEAPESSGISIDDKGATYGVVGKLLIGIPTAPSIRAIKWHTEVALVIGKVDEVQRQRQLHLHLGRYFYRYEVSKL